MRLAFLVIFIISKLDKCGLHNAAVVFQQLSSTMHLKNVNILKAKQNSHFS